MQDSYTANHPLRFRPLLLALHLQTALLLFSLAKYPNSAFLSPATLPHHLRTHLFLLPLSLIFQSSPLPQNPKSRRSCPTVPTSNLTQIRSPPGFLKNVHPYLFPQSPILSTSPSSPVSFIPLSKNPLSHHCQRAVFDSCSRFDTVPACAGRTGRTDGHTTTAYRASIASRSKEIIAASRTPPTRQEARTTTE